MSSGPSAFPVSRRVSLTEECVDILRLAWSGESFNYDGKRYHFDDVRVTPDPVQPGWTATLAGLDQPGQCGPGRALPDPSSPSRGPLDRAGPLARPDAGCGP